MLYETHEHSFTTYIDLMNDDRLTTLINNYEYRGGTRKR